jgi:hypothetical protein
MQQEYLDTSKYQISLHSLDSRFSDLKNNVNSEFRIVNPSVLKNVIRIRLSSLEVPLVEPMFSKIKGNVSFRVRVGTSTTYDTVGYVTDGNYTAGALVNAIDIKLKNISATFSATLSGITGLVTITNTATSFTIDFASPLDSVASRLTHWGLGYYIGFRDTLVNSVYSGVTGGYSVSGSSVINVNANSYYLVRLKCPEEVVNVTHCIGNGNFVSAFAKIILTDSYYQLQFDNNANLVRNEYTFLSPINIPFFQISLLDPWGELVNMMDSDWSYTIEVTEIKNSKVYDTLLHTYQKK